MVRVWRSTASVHQSPTRSLMIRLKGRATHATHAAPATNCFQCVLTEPGASHQRANSRGRDLLPHVAVGDSHPSRWTVLEGLELQQAQVLTVLPATIGIHPVSGSSPRPLANRRRAGSAKDFAERVGADDREVSRHSYRRAARPTASTPKTSRIVDIDRSKTRCALESPLSPRGLTLARLSHRQLRALASRIALSASLL